VPVERQKSRYFLARLAAPSVGRMARQGATQGRGRGADWPGDNPQGYNLQRSAVTAWGTFRSIVPTPDALFLVAVLHAYSCR